MCWPCGLPPVTVTCPSTRCSDRQPGFGALSKQGRARWAKAGSWERHRGTDAAAGGGHERKLRAYACLQAGRRMLQLAPLQHIHTGFKHANVKAGVGMHCSRAGKREGTARGWQSHAQTSAAMWPLGTERPAAGCPWLAATGLQGGFLARWQPRSCERWASSTHPSIPHMPRARSHQELPEARRGLTSRL